MGERILVSGAEAMAAVVELVARGVIAVREDGSIWKLRNLNATPFGEPRRLETKSKRGYFMVRVNAKSRAFLVAAHRVVWTVLRGPIPDGMDINHIDGDKRNNAIENLEVATRSRNIQHAYDTGLRKTSNYPETYAAEATRLRATGLSYSQIGAALGVSGTTAFKAVRHATALVAANVPRRAAVAA